MLIRAYIYLIPTISFSHTGFTVSTACPSHI